MFKFVKKAAPIAAAAAMLAATVTPSFAAHSHYGNKFNLLFYSNLTTPEIKVLQGLATAWASDHGGNVKFLASPGDFSAFATLARSGKGPDAMFGLPQDRMGQFATGGLIAPVPPTITDLSQWVPAGRPAVTLNGKQYAVPLMLDTYTLVYNKKLTKVVPKNFSQLVSIATKFPNKKGSNYGFQFDPTTPYYAYAFVKGCGGYVFKQNGDSLDTSDIGLANAGAVKAYSFFRDLVQKYKLIPPDINDSIQASLFQKGNMAYWIDGDWDIVPNKKAIGAANFAAAPLPAVPGCGTPHPFVTVQTAFVSAYSHNQEVSFQLIKYLSKAMQIPDFQASGRIPALRSALNNSAIRNDPVYAAYAKTALNGDPIPNVAEMQQVWGPMQNNVTLIIRNKVSPQTGANNMVEQIKKGIAQASVG